MSHLIALVLVLLAATCAEAERITVSAAISLKEPLLVIADDFQKQTGDIVEFNFGASGHLATQILSGASVDAFISASQDHVVRLSKANLLVTGPECIVVHNELVLIGPLDGTAIGSFAELVLPAIRRIAIGRPKTVPAGDYAMQVLRHLHLAESLQDRLVYANNARQLIEYVLRGEVDAAIVYRSDLARVRERVRLIATADPHWYGTIDYPAVVLSASTRQATSHRFLDFVMASAAQQVFSSHDFVISRTDAGK